MKKAQSSDLMPLSAVLGLSLQLGVSVAVTATVFVWGGAWLDGHFDTSPTFFWIGATSGLLVSLIIVWQIVRPLRERADVDEKELEEIDKLD